MTRGTRFDDSGEFEVLRERKRPDRGTVDAFLSWAVRVALVGLCTLAYHQAQEIQATLDATQGTLGTVQVTIAKISVVQDNQTKQLDQHTQEIQRLWQERRSP